MMLFVNDKFDFDYNSTHNAPDGFFYSDYVYSRLAILKIENRRCQVCFSSNSFDLCQKLN